MRHKGRYGTGVRHTAMVWVRGTKIGMVRVHGTKIGMVRVQRHKGRYGKGARHKGRYGTGVRHKGERGNSKGDICIRDVFCYRIPTPWGGGANHIMSPLVAGGVIPRGA